MKKFALVLALLAIAGFVFADTVVVPTLSGSANTTFGVDLDSPVATGFTTSASASVAFTLIDSQSATVAGEDDLYGEITVSGYALSGDNSGINTASASASAKIVAGDLYVIIGASPSLESNKAAAIEADNADVKASAAADMGFTLGLTSVGLAIKVVSQDSYIWEGGSDASANTYFVKADGSLQLIDADNPAPAGATVLTAATAAAVAADANDENNYSIGVDFSTAIGDVGSIALSAAYEMGSNNVGFSVGAPLTLGPATVTVGFDGMYAGTFAWDAALGLSLAAGPATVAISAYLGDFAADDVDVKASIDLSALADPLTLTIAAEMWNMFATINLDVALAYDVNGIKPYATLGLDDLANSGAVSLSAGAEISAAASGIDNTAIKLDYTSSDLGNDNGVITASVTISM